jgi:hypothetical protein
MAKILTEMLLVLPSVVWLVYFFESLVHNIKMDLK